MSHQISIDEQLSALTDGELERGTARFLLRRLENDPPLAGTFERYQVMRACMRREFQRAYSDDFCAGVMARIEAEDAQAAAAPPASGGSRWLRRALGGAIAAGVAGLVLFASAPQPAVEAPALTVAQPPTASGLAPMLIAQPVAERSSILLPQQGMITDPRIEQYLVRHSGAVATLGHNGALPYAYAVGLQTRREQAPATDPNIRPAAAVSGPGQ